MADIISCPACQRKLQVPEAFYGQMVQCPECRHMFTAAAPSTGVQPNAPPPSPPSAVPDWQAPPARGPRRAYEEDAGYGDEPARLRRPTVPHRGGMILALGIVGLVMMPCLTIVCGPMAWVMGSTDLAEIRAGRMDRAGEGLTQAGRILGIISTVLMIVMVVCYCLFFMLMIAAEGLH